MTVRITKVINLRRGEEEPRKRSMRARTRKTTMTD
jgi:hypothetical protein